ncbi:MAG: 3-hydroxybutyrate oligomer hydrolase family protein [Rhodoferax sp.]|nr:3-hydroxybutyrate oligomer hydrolase family protein [Rhodoferax sp.]
MQLNSRPVPTLLAALLGSATLIGCGGGGGDPESNLLPSGVTQLSRVAYRATVAGTGSTAAAPAYANPAAPTADELRRNALIANYRGLVDNTVKGGYGVLYGPNIDLSGKDTLGEGLVPGLEYVGVLDDGSGKKNVTMAIQIPDNFDVNAPCIVVGPSSGSRGVYGAIAASGYTNAFGRFSVADNICGMSAAAVDATGSPVAISANAKAASFATGNGTVNGTPATVVYNDSVGGAKPVIVVAGRSDALLPVNNSARAYTAYNRVAEGAATKLRYIEVTNAQHFDAFIAFSGFDTRYVPLHAYFTQAMNAMHAHLKSGAALPASQVVRTTARGGAPGAAPAITAAQVPPISVSPVAGDQIGFSGTSVNVPN